jgi:CheY-like chemotaxis protein
MKILMVEESPMVRRFIKDELSPGGFDILEATTPSEALEVLKNTEEISLITMRLVMKEMDGFKFLEFLRSPETIADLRPMKNDDVPVIIVTSNDTDEDRLKGYQVGATNFIQKPWPPGDLLANVNLTLGKGTQYQDMSVLVVDDSPTARRFIRNSLNQLGVSIYEADDGNSAFDFLKKGDHEIDLVITDLNMVHMDGDELCVKIRGELGLKKMPVIFLSGNDDKGKVLSLYKMGATDYLMKPFISEELLARMQAYLERERAHKKLQATVAELETMSKLKDEFLAVCSHDLRSPLVGILGYADLLSDEDLPEDNLEMVHGISNSGNYLLSLINDILDLGKIENGGGELVLEPVALDEILKSSITTLTHTATPKGVNVEMAVETENVGVNGNVPALTRICNNLLSNAIKFTEKGGLVKGTIAAGRTGEITLTIKDSGMGIPADKIPMLFDKYSSASRSGTNGEKGTGLGMIITHELIEAHGGTISVQSEENIGTEIIVHLPLLEEESEEISIDLFQMDKPKKTVKVAQKKEGPLQRILLVDDEATNQAVGRGLLKKQGYEVVCADDGRQAVEQYQNSCEGEPFHAIFMDLEMPELGGLDASRLIRDFESDLPADHQCRVNPVPIIAMSAHAAGTKLSDCLEAGMNDFLAKPYKVSELREALNQWIQVPV